MLREDPAYAAKAARVSTLVRDVSEFIDAGALPAPAPFARPTVAYHAACSLQHGQKITQAPKALLKAAGFDVRDVRDGHLCCGSAGTYNVLQSDIAMRLREQKLAAIAETGADVIAAGNIGCLTQLREDHGKPTLHVVELLDWATGGPRPPALAG